MAISKKQRSEVPWGLPKWAAKLFTRFYTYLQQEKNLVELSAVGINGLKTVVPLAEALERLEAKVEEVLGDQEASTMLEGEGPERTGADERSAVLRKRAELADSEIRGGFRLLHAHSLVGVWGAFEAMVEDLVIEWLVNVPSALERDAFAKVTVPVAEYERLSRADRMKAIVRELERKNASPYRAGVGQFEHVLEAVGLDGPVPKRARDRLFEYQQIRHVYVHRGGVADRRFTEACPRFNASVGKPIPIGQEEYLDYLLSVAFYGNVIANRVRIGLGLAESPVKPLPARLSRRYRKRT